MGRPVTGGYHSLWASSHGARREKLDRISVRPLRCTGVESAVGVQPAAAGLPTRGQGSGRVQGRDL